MNSKNICTERELEFAVFCIENVAAKLKTDAEKIYSAVKGLL